MTETKDELSLEDLSTKSKELISSNPLDFVKVNVGGKIYHLSKIVISNSTYFQGLLKMKKHNDSILSSIISNPKDLTDELIDRNYTHFEYILDCIRDPNYINIERLNSIKPELIYYGFEPILALCSDKEVEKPEIKIKKAFPEAKYSHLKDIFIIYYCERNLIERYRLSTGWNGETTFKTGLDIEVPKGYIALVEFYVGSDRGHIKILSNGTHKDASLWFTTLTIRGYVQISEGDFITLRLVKVC